MRLRTSRRAILCLFLASLFHPSFCNAREVHLVSPDINESNDDDPTNLAWTAAVKTIREGDTVYLGDRVYHVGKHPGFGGWARVFMDADSPEPAVIKFETYPARTRSYPKVNLKGEFETLKELERHGYPVGKALELGPMGLSMRQQYVSGVTVTDYFKNVFPYQAPAQRKRAIALLDVLYRSLAKDHLLTNDLNGKNVIINPETGAPTIIDPGEVIPGAGEKEIKLWETIQAQGNAEALQIFEQIRSQATCLSTIESIGK